jgi:rare lipoprotein A (peptidoglycan hydrolase)
MLVCYDSRVVVAMTDQGPAAWTGRQLDLSVGAAWAIGLEVEGGGWVEVY